MTHCRRRHGRRRTLLPKTSVGMCLYLNHKNNLLNGNLPIGPIHHFSRIDLKQPWIILELGILTYENSNPHALSLVPKKNNWILVKIGFLPSLTRLTFQPPNDSNQPPDHLQQSDDDDTVDWREHRHSLVAGRKVEKPGCTKMAWTSLLLLNTALLPVVARWFPRPLFSK